MIQYDVASATAKKDGEGHEYAVLLRSGGMFYTSGWESRESLRNSIRGDHGAAGTFDPNSSTYYETDITLAFIEAIVDLREKLS